MNPNLADFRAFARESDSIIPPEAVRIAFDLGSRDGEVALYMEEHYPQAQIFAFECNPAAVELVRKNIAGHDRVTLVNRAVADTNGTLEFFSIDPQKTVTPHKDGNIGASSLYRANPDYPHENYVQQRVLVESVRLDDWAGDQQITAVDVIWMDLQGAELRAMHGLGKLLSTVKVLYTEVEYKQLYLDQPLAADLRRFLARHGLGLHKQMNVGEWAGDELFRHMGRSAWWKLYGRELARTGKSWDRKAYHLSFGPRREPAKVSTSTPAEAIGRQ